MQRIGHFLHRKHPSVDYRPSEYADFAAAIMNLSVALADSQHKAEWTVNQRLIAKLHLAGFTELSLRLSKRAVYAHQKKVKITFKHTEALTLITFFQGNKLDVFASNRYAMIIQYTINQLAKYYT